MSTFELSVADCPWFRDRLNSRPDMFRPCIDLHQGQVKQIVGGTMQADGTAQTNYASDRPSSWFADLYRRDELFGGHIVMLGPGNERAAREALAAFPGGMQLGGGITSDNAASYLDAGASHVIVTSWLFERTHFLPERLKLLATKIGRSRLVVDLSCRRQPDGYRVASDRWRTLTDLRLTSRTLESIGQFCSEFLIHAVDVEGRRQGVDLELVRQLPELCPLPVTYAGGARSLEDLRLVHREGRGKVNLTIGSALDIFGGTGLSYDEAVAFNHSLL